MFAFIPTLDVAHLCQAQGSAACLCDTNFIIVSTSRCWNFFLTNCARLKANMATAEVLNTVELIESILSQLPTLDLLISQRVSSRWRDVIKKSKKLQTALFLSPSLDVGLKREKVYLCCKFSRLMRLAHVNLTELAIPLPLPVYVDGDSDEAYTITENPLLPVLFKESAYASSKLWMTQEIAKADESASWRAMYISSPPILDMRFVAAYETPDGDVKEMSEVMSCETIGITIGEFVQRILDITAGDKLLCVEITDKQAWNPRSYSNLGLSFGSFAAWS